MSIRMIGYNVCRLFLVVCVFGASLASAQRTTEQYIPIGQSPGVSGAASYVGKIVAIDRDRHTISIDDQRGVRRVRVTEKTLIWFDRSKLSRENTVAGYGDCEVGVNVEVMHTGNDETTAEWIKIEAP